MTEGIIVGYVILGLTLACFLAFLIVRLTWGRKIKFPEGNKTDFKYNEFNSTLIVDKTVSVDGNSYIVDGQKMDKTILTKMCAMSMEAFDYTAKNYGPEQLRKKNKLTHCVFVFLPEDKYYDKMIKMYGSKTPSAGFSSTLSYNMSTKQGPYVCYMRTKYMMEVYTTGYLSVHEYTHCYSSAVAGNWDAAHDLWKFKAINGKSLQNIAVQRIKDKLELDKKLQS